MVEPAAKKAAVDHLVREHRMSERRACRLLRLPRATKRYQAKSPPDDGLRQRLGELARRRQRFGYRRLTALLQREGRQANHKRVYRLYRDLGLALQRKRRRRILRTGVPQTKGQPSSSSRVICGVEEQAVAWKEGCL
jgi:putative transposase